MIDQTQRSFLKIQFRTDAFRTKTFQATYNSFIQKGRALRTKGFARNSEKTVKLHDKGCLMALRAHTMNAYFQAGNGRSLTLALACLNNTPYVKCETKPQTAPDTKRVAEYLKGCLPRAHRDLAEGYIQEWIKTPTSTLRQMMEAQEVMMDRAKKLREGKAA